MFHVVNLQVLLLFRPRTLTVLAFSNHEEFCPARVKVNKRLRRISKERNTLQFRKQWLGRTMKITFNLQRKGPFLAWSATLEIYMSSADLPSDQTQKHCQRPHREATSLQGSRIPSSPGITDTVRIQSTLSTREPSQHTCSYLTNDIKKENWWRRGICIS